MRTRNHDWYDTKKERPMYSFQVWDAKGKKWLHVLDDNGPCIYETEAERDAKRKEVSKRKAH